MELKRIVFSLISSAAVLSAGGNSCVTTSEIACVPDSSIRLFGGTEGIGVSYSKRVDSYLPHTVLKFSVAGLNGYSRTLIIVESIMMGI